MLHPPVFDGANDDDVWSTIEEEAGMSSVMVKLYPLRWIAQVEPFDNRISGVMYMLKLALHG